jgi:hypothetical protein
MTDKISASSAAGIFGPVDLAVVLCEEVVVEVDVTGLPGEYPM